MPLNAHSVSVAVFVRGLTNLKSLLEKGEAHAASNEMDPLDLIHAKLADDMYNLAIQVNWAAEGAKLAVARLLGITLSPLAGEAKTFTELQERIDTAIAYLNTIDTRDLERGLTCPIELKHKDQALTFLGCRFLLEFAIPNFFFHLTTAYGVLRSKGVNVTKGDFTGIAFG